MDGPAYEDSDAVRKWNHRRRETAFPQAKGSRRLWRRRFYCPCAHALGPLTIPFKT